MERTQNSNTQIANTQIRKFRWFHRQNLCFCVFAIFDLVHEDPSWTIFEMASQNHKFLFRPGPINISLLLHISSFSMTTRGPGFSEAEVASLLDIIEDILPNSPNDWERVTEAHRNLFPDLKRNTKSLKRKFEALYNHRKPTGDPTCPVAVRKAKLIWEEIKSGMDFSDAEGELVLHSNVSPQDNDEEEAETAPNAAPAQESPEGVQACVPHAPPVPAPAQAAVGVIASTPTPSVIGQRIRTPRRQQTNVQPSSMTSDLIQFMMLRAELEDKRRNEREEREEIRARRQEAAEERRRADEAEERRERSAMMQMLMMGILDGQRSVKRKRGNSEENNSHDE